MNSEKTLVRHLLFAAVVIAAGLCLYCTGCCCTAAVLLDSEFGSRSTRFNSPRYTMSPDRREIIVTSTKTTDFHYAMSFSMQNFPFFSPKTLWSWRSNWEERIPLDPMPECLMRCFLIAEPDPNAQPYWFHSRGGFEMETGRLPLGTDETLHLRIRPDELNLLSRPFWVKLIPREDEHPEADGIDPTGQKTPQDEEAVPPEKKPDDDLRVMFPVGIYGNMYVLLTVVPREPRPNPIRERPNRNIFAPSQTQEQAASEWDIREEVRYLYPFREEQEEIFLTEYERRTSLRSPTPDATLWKALWLPPAIVADTLLMPWYVVSFGGAFLMIYTVGSAIQ